MLIQILPEIFRRSDFLPYSETDAASAAVRFAVKYV